LDSVLSEFGKIWKVGRVELLLKRMFGCRLVLMSVCAGNHLKLQFCDGILIGITQPSINHVIPRISRSFFIAKKNQKASRDAYFPQKLRRQAPHG
jgi:hypothetical protein